ncbi:MAG TPA: alpha-L-rhamnosidase C-terminal domain-containing protein, partial [Fimbriimonadaceae bacterium]|nr:alpha-L-rhamnosidase C-terminal domain-containing protein [Fimbriimonadaceae bacterium]
ADGQYPMVAPLKVAGDDGGPAWADAGVICPWAVFEVYGDRRQLEEHYPGMKKFVDFCRKRSTPDLLPPEKFHCFGDWLNIEAETPHDVIYQAYFAGSAELLSKAAAVLGKGEEAKEYGELARRVKEAFVKAYVTPEGKVTGDTQCAYVLALGFDIVTDELAEKAAQHLVRDIEKRGWHLSTGFVGTRDLMHVLSKIGRDDVAFKLLHQATFPSWKFEILNGATSIWERWDSWTPDKGLQDPGMNSFAHYAYGAVMGWVFSNIGGISAGAPGYELIKIAPKIDPNLTWAKTSYDSVRGMIRTSWKREGNQLSLTVQIPPNTTAEITMPGQDARAQSGELVRSGVFNVGSGEHTFTSSLR